MTSVSRVDRLTGSLVAARISKADIERLPPADGPVFNARWLDHPAHDHALLDGTYPWSAPC